MEAAETSLAEKSVEDVTHFMEEGNDVVVAHCRGLAGYCRGGSVSGDPYVSELANSRGLARLATIAVTG